MTATILDDGPHIFRIIRRALWNLTIIRCHKEVDHAIEEDSLVATMEQAFDGVANAIRFVVVLDDSNQCR